MSGGRGAGGQGSPRSTYGVTVNPRTARTGIRAASPATGPRGAGPANQGGARGEPRRQAEGAEPAPANIPTSKGPTGFDTGGAGTDLAARIAAARKPRTRPARGGGLSNVRLGAETLG